MNTYFKTVTEETLKNMNNRYYGGGKKIKIGDKIISGYNINYANLRGHAPGTINEDEISLSLQIFVLNESDGMIYQLYKSSKLK